MKRELTAENDAGQSWSLARRRLVSGLIAFHLAAVVFSPLSIDGAFGSLFAPFQFLRRYATALYLDHGYRFFAPDPGPTHTLRFEHGLSEASMTVGSLPDRERTWPRQLYHRWFMVGESLANEVGQTLASYGVFVQDQRQLQNAIDDLQRQGRIREASELQALHARNQAEFDRRWQMVRSLAAAIKRHLEQKYPGETIRLYSRRQLIPSPSDVRLGKPLTLDEFHQEIEVTNPQGVLDGLRSEEVSPPEVSR